MVKILENQIIDLDILPGKEQQELKKRIQEHIAKTGYVQYLQCASTSARLFPTMSIQKKHFLLLYSNSKFLTFYNSHARREQTTASLPPEDRKQLEEAQRKVSTQAANAATGVAGTLGGAVKGVLDTAGNTVTIHPPPFFVLLAAGKSCDTQKTYM